MKTIHSNWTPILPPTSVSDCPSQTNGRNSYRLIPVSADRSAIKRLAFIAGACPALAPQALSKAVDYALQGQDTQLYQAVLNLYNSTVGPQNALLGDQEWLDKTSARAQAEKDKLEVELKMYTGNMIKESVRVCVWRGCCGPTMRLMSTGG